METIKTKLLDLIKLEEKRKENYKDSNWNEDKQEGYIRGLKTVLNLLKKL